MEKTIKETTRLLMQGTLTKDEADKILLDLHNVSNQRTLLLAFMGYIYCIGDQVFTGDEDSVIDNFLSKQ